MPVFEYHCIDCDYKFEKWLPSNIVEDLVKSCPKCDNYNVEKLISAPNFRLIGSGFYENDYKTKRRQD